MIEIKRLGDIAEVRTGYTFREKINEVECGSAFVLQLKDARAQQERVGDDAIRVNELTQLDWQGKESHFVEAGMVVLPARGDYFRASYIPEAKTELPLIVSSQFMLIKPQTSIIAPAFLCWSLNQAKVQRQLSKCVQGTSLNLLKIDEANMLEIRVPSLDVQHNIVQINTNWQQERQVTMSLLANRERMLQGIFQEILKG